MTRRQKKALLIISIIFVVILFAALTLQETIKDLLLAMVTTTIDWIVNYCKVIGWAI